MHAQTGVLTLLSPSGLFMGVGRITAQHLLFFYRLLWRPWWATGERRRSLNWWLRRKLMQLFWCYMKSFLQAGVLPPDFIPLSCEQNATKLTRVPTDLLQFKPDRSNVI